MKKISLAVALVCGVLTARADLVFNSLNSPVTFDFSGFTGGGFNPTPGAGQLDSDDIYVTGFSDNWVSGTPGFGGTSSNTADYARGSGTDAATTAGVYNFTNTSSTALGLLPTASEFNPGAIRLRIQNNTGFQITGFNISYDLYYRSTSGGLRTQAVFAAISSDNFASSSNAIPELALQALSTSTWSTNSASILSTPLVVNNGDYFYLQFNSADAGGSGSRPKLAFDNITITAVPEPGTVVLFGMGIAALWTVRRRNNS